LAVGGWHGTLVLYKRGKPFEYPGTEIFTRCNIDVASARPIVKKAVVKIKNSSQVETASKK
jgi:hypothetical protein